MKEAKNWWNGLTEDQKLKNLVLSALRIPNGFSKKPSDLNEDEILIIYNKFQEK